MKVVTETARLQIKTWDPSEVDDAFKLWGDPQVMALIDVRGGLERKQVEEKLAQEVERQEKFGVQYWKVVDRKTGDLIGCCGLRPYQLNEKVYEIGFHISSQYWGKGFATEAAHAVISYAFNKLKIPKLFAGHNPKNDVSGKLLKKLGFNFIENIFYEPTGLMHPSYELLNQSE